MQRLTDRLNTKQASVQNGYDITHRINSTTDTAKDRIQIRYLTRRGI